MVLLTAACTKEGPAGLEGPVGANGEIGPAGKDGSVMLAGSGTPDASLGSVGDYYLDKVSKVLYGPKTEDTGWGVPVDLTGSAGPAGNDGTDGTAGKDGSQIYAGTTIPASSMGANGDFYFNKSTYDLYGPKSAGDWGTPVNLKGMSDIIYSSWISADWSFYDQPTKKEMKIPVNQLENTELRNSVVMVYLRQFGTSAIFGMPGPGRWTNAFYNFEFGNNSSVTTKSIVVTIQSTDGATLTEYQYAAIRGNYFRYVIIPLGSVASSAAAHPVSTYSINYNDYNEVKRYFGIK